MNEFVESILWVHCIRIDVLHKGARCEPLIEKSHSDNTEWDHFMLTQTPVIFIQARFQRSSFLSRTVWLHFSLFQDGDVIMKKS